MQLAFCLGWFFISISAVAEEAIGKVIFAEGKLTALQAKQAPRLLRRGSPIFPGNILVTGEQSQGQIRFSDGALLNLQANSQFQIEAYQNEAGNKRFNGKLLKGAFRAVSGTIAKEQPQNYQINTAVATIGVRGTDYSVALDQHNELSAGVWQGKISLSNTAGAIVIGEDSPYKFAHIASAATLPQGLTQMPVILLNKNNQHSAFNVTDSSSTNPSDAQKNSNTSTDSKEICIQ